MKILRVETRQPPEPTEPNTRSLHVLDYRVYDRVPRAWRRIEEKLRLDLYLSWRARQIEQEFDLIWAGSEKVGIPLALFGTRRPLVVIAHHPESPLKARIVQALGLARHWSAVGYICNESRSFLIDRLGVPADRLFQYVAARHLQPEQPAAGSIGGPMISVGVAKRDYPTLLAALSKLPQVEAEIFPSSRFGDRLAKRIDGQRRESIRVVDFLPEAELLQRYRSARFVVVPLKHTTHGGAGASAALEACTFGKAVIATRTGGMRTFVEDGKTGLLVPPNDVEALRAAISTLWENPALAQRMGAAGRRHVERHFDPETVKDRIQAMLDRVAGVTEPGRDDESRRC